MYQAFLLQKSYFFHYKSIVILYLWLYVFCRGGYFQNSVNIPNFITFCLYIKTINSHWYLKFQFNTTEVVPFFSFPYLFFHSLSDKKKSFSLSSVWISFNQITQHNHLYHFSYSRAGLLTLFAVLILTLCRLLHGQPLLWFSLWFLNLLQLIALILFSALYNSRNGREERGQKDRKENKRKCVKKGYAFVSIGSFVF